MCEIPQRMQNIITVKLKIYIAQAIPLEYIILILHPLLL